VLLTAAAVLAAVSIVLALTAIVLDRRATLGAIQQQTQSMAKLLIAHSEAAIEDANKVFSAILPMVETWDLKDQQQGRAIFDRIKEMLPGSPQLSSAWIMDSSGTSILDTWSYPSTAIDGSARPYFQAHQTGTPEPVILGDDRPGAISGRRRFTFSRSFRNPDGSLRAILVAGVYADFFENLYREVATWPGATGVAEQRQQRSQGEISGGRGWSRGSQRLLHESDVELPGRPVLGQQRRRPADVALTRAWSRAKARRAEGMCSPGWWAPPSEPSRPSPATASPAGVCCSAGHSAARGPAGASRCGRSDVLNRETRADPPFERAVLDRPASRRMLEQLRALAQSSSLRTGRSSAL
jgi:hypothetical protein